MIKEQNEEILKKVLYLLFSSLGFVAGMIAFGVMVEWNGALVYDDVLDEICKNLTNNTDAKYNSVSGRSYSFECIIGEPKPTKDEVKISVIDYTKKNSKTYKHLLTGREWTEYED